MTGRKQKPSITTRRKREHDSSVCSENVFDILSEQKAGDMEVITNETSQNVNYFKKKKVPPIVVTISSEFKFPKGNFQRLLMTLKLPIKMAVEAIAAY